MKRLMFLAVAAIGLVACSKTFEVQPTTETPIGFGSWANTLTKAESRVAGSNTFLSGDTFNVYGYKTVSSTSSNVFNGDVVTAKGASTPEIDGEAVDSWVYSPLRFWDPTASSYTFFAVSPSGKIATAPTALGGEYTGLFTSKPITFGGQDNDVLVATKKEVTAAVGTPKYSNDPVQIQFNHIASLIDVKVKKDATLPEGATLKITAARLDAINKTGTFTVHHYDETTFKPVLGTTTPVNEWGWVSTASDNYTATTATAENPLIVSAATTYDTTEASPTEHEATSTSGTPQALFNGYVLMPQDLSAGTQKLHLEYKIVTQEANTEVVPPVAEVSDAFTADIALKDFVITDKNNNAAGALSAVWAPGTHYTYIVTISANAINFTASINPWTDVVVDGYHYLVQ